MNKAGMILLVFLLSALIGTAAAEIKQTEAYGTHEHFETHKIMTRPAADDLTPPNDRIKYRYPAPRERGVNVCVDPARSTFRNCRVAYDCCFVPSSGEWSTGCILIEPIEVGAPWDYNLEIEMIY